MTFRHFLITRFSYRGKDAFKEIAGPTFHRGGDPLEPARLELRFKVFEFTCLPSVLAQSEANFAWIILVDRALPAKYHDRLRSLTKYKKDTFIHPFDPQVSLATLGWLRPYLSDDNDYVITTNLDDDDSLPTRYVAEIQTRLGRLERIDAAPLTGIVGARQIIEWDLLTSRDAPFGWKASWHRGPSVASAGLTLSCKAPNVDLCVLALRHVRAETYLDFSRPPAHGNVRWFQDTIVRAAQAVHVDVTAWDHDDLFHDISEEVGPVLMTNHVRNDQTQRLFEQKTRARVTGPGDFPGLPIDWEKARAYAPSFESTDA